MGTAQQNPAPNCCCYVLTHVVICVCLIVMIVSLSGTLLPSKREIPPIYWLKHESLHKTRISLALSAFKSIRAIYSDERKTMNPCFMLQKGTAVPVHVHK